MMTGCGERRDQSSRSQTHARPKRPWHRTKDGVPGPIATRICCRAESRRSVAHAQGSAGHAEPQLVQMPAALAEHGKAVFIGPQRDRGSFGRQSGERRIEAGLRRERLVEWLAQIIAHGDQSELSQLHVAAGRPDSCTSTRSTMYFSRKPSTGPTVSVNCRSSRKRSICSWARRLNFSSSTSRGIGAISPPSIESESLGRGRSD